MKDDLIVKVDELTGEIEILREELNTANQARNKLRQKVSDLEDELKQNKSLAKAHGASRFSGYILNGRFHFYSIFCLQPIPIKKTKATYRWLNVSDSLESKWHAF